MPKTKPTHPSQEPNHGGAILGGIMLAGGAVYALGEKTGLGFVGVGYLLSGMIAAGGMLFILHRMAEDDRDVWWHPLSAWPIAAAVLWFSSFSGLNYMAEQTNPVLYEAARGLGRSVEARWLPFYATTWFKLSGFALIAAVRFIQHVTERKYQH